MKHGTPSQANRGPKNPSRSTATFHRFHFIGGEGLPKSGGVAGNLRFVRTFWRSSYTSNRACRRKPWPPRRSV